MLASHWVRTATQPTRFWATAQRGPTQQLELWEDLRVLRTEELAGTFCVTVNTRFIFSPWKFTFHQIYLEKKKTKMNLSEQLYLYLLLVTKYHCKYLCIEPLNPPNDPMKQTPLSPFYGWRNWSMGRPALCQVTQMSRTEGNPFRVTSLLQPQEANASLANAAI